MSKVDITPFIDLDLTEDMVKILRASGDITLNNHGHNQTVSWISLRGLRSLSLGIRPIGGKGFDPYNFNVRIYRPADDGSYACRLICYNARTPVDLIRGEQFFNQDIVLRVGCCNVSGLVAYTFPIKE